MEIVATSAENRLWRAVLEQAYEDAELPQMEDGSDPEALARARRYLRADSPPEEEHLKLVCEFAEVPFDRIVSFARKRYSCPPQESADEILRPRRKAPRPQDDAGCRAAVQQDGQNSRPGKTEAREPGALEVGAQTVGAAQIGAREARRIS